MAVSNDIEEVLRTTRIYQILRPKLVMALPTLSVQEALDLMRLEKSGYLVIADENSKLVGMFTEREVLMKILGNPKAKMSEPLSNYMRTDLHTLSKSDTIDRALFLMNEFNVRHIPLLDEFGQVSGVLSVRTIVRFLAELFPTEVLNLPPDADQVHSSAEGG
jgi:CBS domain-containing protein